MKIFILILALTAISAQPISTDAPPVEASSNSIENDESDPLFQCHETALEDLKKHHKLQTLYSNEKNDHKSTSKSLKKCEKEVKEYQDSVQTCPDVHDTDLYKACKEERDAAVKNKTVTFISSPNALFAVAVAIVLSLMTARLSGCPDGTVSDFIILNFIICVCVYFMIVFCQIYNLSDTYLEHVQTTEALKQYLTEGSGFWDAIATRSTVVYVVEYAEYVKNEIFGSKLASIGIDEIIRESQTRRGSDFSFADGVVSSILIWVTLTCTRFLVYGKKSFNRSRDVGIWLATIGVVAPWQCIRLSCAGLKKVFFSQCQTQKTKDISKPMMKREIYKPLKKPYRNTMITDHFTSTGYRLSNDTSTKKSPRQFIPTRRRYFTGAQ